MKYEKLVRDKIPDIIKENGEKPITHIAGEQEYREALTRKLQEEVDEFLTKKVYLVDNSFIAAKSFQFSQNLGKLMENLTFAEFLRMGYKPNNNLFYYKTKNDKEIDFVLKKGIKIEKLVQVCYEANNIETKKREMAALIEASKELNCENLEIVTWDEEREEKLKDKKIKFVPLWKWLLRV